MKKITTVVVLAITFFSVSSASAFTGLKSKSILFNEYKLKANPMQVGFLGTYAYNSSITSKLSSKKADEGGDAFAQGKFIISAGYGFPNLGKAIVTAMISDSSTNVKATGIGPIHFRAEYALTDGVGLGVSVNYIAFGVKYTELPYEYEISRSSLSILARVNFHFGTTESLDPYFGVGAGYKQAEWKFTSTDPNYQEETLPGFSPFGFETTIGIRYYFVPGFGVYTELGIAKSVIQAGLVAAF